MCLDGWLDRLDGLYVLVKWFIGLQVYGFLGLGCCACGIIIIISLSLFLGGACHVLMQRRETERELNLGSEKRKG